MVSRSLKLNLAANLLGQAYSNILNIVFLPLYMTILGPASYGLIGIFAVLQAALSVLDMGMSPALSREAARSIGNETEWEKFAHLLRSVEVVVLLTASLVSCLLALSSDWIAANWVHSVSLERQEVSSAFVLMALLAVSRLAENIYRNCLLGMQKHVVLTILNCLSVTVRSVGAVLVLTLLSGTVGTFFLWQLAVSVVTIAVLAVAVYREISVPFRQGRFSFEALADISKFGGGVFLIAVLTILLTQSDKVLLSRMLTLEEFGYYAFAVSAAAVLNSLVGPIAQTWYPRMTHLYAQQDAEGFASTYHLGSQIVSVVMGSAALTIIWYSDLVLQVWTGDPVLTERISALLALLALGNLLNGLFWIPYHAQLASGNTRIAIRLNLVSLFVLGPLFLLIVPKFGALGAASVWIVLNAAYLIVGVGMMHRQLLNHEKLRWYLMDTLAPILAGCVAAMVFRLIAREAGTVGQMFGVLIVASLCTMVASSLAAGLVRSAAISVIRRVVGRFA